MCVFLQWFFFKKTSVCRQDDFQPKAKISQLQKHVVSAAIEKERQSLIIDTGTLAEKKTGSGSFFFFHQKSFCFLFRDFCQTVEKTKKRIVSALDLIITSERSRSKNNKTPSFPPRFSYFLDDDKYTFAENNEPFFVVHALVARSVLPLVVN